MECLALHISILLNFKTGDCLSVAGSGKTVFDVLLQGAGTDEVLKEVEKVDSIYLADTQQLIEVLQSHEILIEGANPLQSAHVSFSMTDRPTVQVFADMADLIKSDSVHEADEALGWTYQ